MKVCPNCGAQCPDFQLFCQNCGARLNTLPQEAVYTVTFRWLYERALDMYITVDDKERYGMKPPGSLVLRVSPGQHNFKIKFGTTKLGFKTEVTLLVSEDMVLDCIWRAGFWKNTLEVRDINGRIYSPDQQTF